MPRVRDQTGWPIFEGAHFRVNPSGGRAYWAVVVTVDGTRVTARDRKGLMRFADPNRCCVLRGVRKEHAPQADVPAAYKNPFPKDGDQ